MRWYITVFSTLIFLMAACSNGSHEVKASEVTWGTLKIHNDGMLVKDIDLLENKEVLTAVIDIYNDADIQSVEENDQAHVSIDPISTDESLLEKHSASHFSIDVESTGNHYYIGYKGHDIFKVIASGDEFKELPSEYFIESRALKEIIIDNG
ncbi:hypothetical protein H0266_14320 [Halobacillus locisalis]|uniref:Uncharacterized protein n=1 Tax=Halobacillus locisalis TaxID=220753 RepID=A0A838CVV5_9BACI|nr:hypothetical protein [Halobacillus locisalis]MBA2176068.1 hypothetical protein [Halobacillus locisalis]